MSEVLKVHTVPSIQSNVPHVEGVESGVCGCIQSNITHVGGVESELFHILCTALYEHKIKVYDKGVKRDSKYTIRAVMLCMLKVLKEAQNTLQGLMTFLLITFLIFNQFSI